VVLLTSYSGADIRTTPLHVGTRRFPWQHRFPSNRATKPAFCDRIYQKRKGLKFQNRHICSRCGPGHMTQFGESRSKMQTPLRVVTSTSYSGANMRTTPNECDTICLLWKCRLPSNRVTNYGLFDQLGHVL